MHVLHNFVHNHIMYTRIYNYVNMYNTYIHKYQSGVKVCKLYEIVRNISRNNVRYEIARNISNQN